jgi:hypothetical protein
MDSANTEAFNFISRFVTNLYNVGQRPLDNSMTQIKDFIENISAVEPILDPYVDDIKNSVNLVKTLNITSDIDFFTRVLSEMKLPMHYMVKNVIMELVGFASRQPPLNFLPILRSMLESNVSYIKPYIAHGISILKNAAKDAAQPAVTYPAYRNDMDYNTGDMITWTDGKVYKFKERIGAAGYNPQGHPDRWILVSSGGRRKAKTSRRLKRKSKTGKTKSR